MAGKSKIEIDAEGVFKLAKLHCSVDEIAFFYDCSRDTIHRRFQAEIDRGKAAGKEKLRRLQWQAAESGSIPILIWLGKQILNQRDKFPDEMPEAVAPVHITPETLITLLEKAKEK